MHRQMKGGYRTKLMRIFSGMYLIKKTQEHLPFVTIRIKGTMIAITTDATGGIIFYEIYPQAILQWRSQ